MKVCDTILTNPQLIIYTGPMHGGKTTRMLSRLERYFYQKKKIILFKPMIDERYSTDFVQTHSGIKWEAERVADGEAILESVADAQVVAVDEQFMIPGSANALIHLYSQGKTVLVSTLQLSYEPAPFREVARLMPWATSIEVCPAVCAKCDADAYFTRRTSGGTEVIEVGGSEAYEPLCFEHYEEFKRRNNEQTTSDD